MCLKYLKVKNLLAGMMMIAVAGLAFAITPTHRIADQGAPVNLDSIIPARFGDWAIDEKIFYQQVSPEVKASLDKIYTQTLSRTYVNTKGERIMLSIAYGADQSDAKQLHYPEVCYPAQGFQIVSTQLGAVKTGFGNIRVKRIMTVSGNRTEPLTYWTTVGNQVVVGGKETKLEQLRYGFRGQIPDGLLFRVSSIAEDANQGYSLQDEFLKAIIAAMPANNRLRIAGIASNGSQR
jgi:EpsI family protein